MNDLYHFGIKGQRWGIRRYQNEDGTLTEEGRIRYERGVARQAKKDAKKYVTAKMYYGEGAGIRRRHLGGELEKKMKDPLYKKYFENAVANTNTEKAVKRAKIERNVKNVVTKAAGPVAVTAAAVYYVKNKEKVDNAVGNAFAKLRLDPRILAMGIQTGRAFF